MYFPYLIVHIFIWKLDFDYVFIKWWEMRNNHMGFDLKEKLNVTSPIICVCPIEVTNRQIKCHLELLITTDTIQIQRNICWMHETLEDWCHLMIHDLFLKFLIFLRRRGGETNRKGSIIFPYIRVDKLMHTFPGAREHYTLTKIILSV